MKNAYVYIFLFFILVQPMKLSCAMTCVVIENGEYRAEQLADLLPPSLVMGSFTVCADITLDNDEVRTLFPFIIDATVTVSDIERSFWYCVQKNKIEKALVYWEVDSDKKYHFNCQLTAFLTCGSIKVKGAILRKEFYKNLYDFRTGDRFDEKKHAQSLDKISQQCKNEGYCAALVHASLDYNQHEKTVTIVLYINKGNRFTMTLGDIFFHGEWDVAVQEELRAYIKQKYINQLSGRSYYEHTLCALIINDAKDFLLRHKGIHVTIEQKEKYDEQERSVVLECHITLIHTCAYIFEGNRSFSSSELNNLIAQFGRSAALLPATLLAQEIERFYKARGFWDISIDIVQGVGRYVFVITEGDRVAIKKVLVKTKEGKTVQGARSFFRPLIRQKFYNEDCLHKCCNNFLEKYYQDGFLSASFTSYDYKKNLRTQSYDLLLTLHEGKKRFIKEVTIDGWEHLSREGPFAPIYYKKKFPVFKTDVIDDQRQWLLRYLKNHGFAKVFVKPVIVGDIHEDVKIIWHIQNASAPTTFGPSIIEGVNPLLYRSVRDACHYIRGNQWHDDSIRYTLAELNDREIFESVFITPGKAFRDEQERPVIIRLHKDDPYEVRLRAGLELQHVQKYQTFSGLAYRVGASFIVKNPTAIGDHMRIDVDIARSHYEIMGEYKRPFVCFVPWNMSAQLYATKYGQPAFVGSRDTIYTMWQRGFLIDIKRKYTPPCEVAISGGIEWMKTAITDTSYKQQALEIARALNLAPLLVGRSVPYFFFEPTFFIDFLDNKLNPRQGMLTVISAKGMIRLKKGDGPVSFVRILGQQSIFIPLGWVTGALQFRVGHIFYASFSHIMPSERFYLGGSHSLRSYDTDLAPPLGIFLNHEGEPQYVPRGGRSMLNITAEARIPLFKNIGGVLFCDGGILSADNFADIVRDSWLAAVGMGVRFFTPVGPLRFDIGWSPFKKPGFHRSYAWFLTFGHAF